MHSGRMGNGKHFSPVHSSESGTEHSSSEIINFLISAKAVQILNLYADIFINRAGSIVSSSFFIVNQSKSSQVFLTICSVI